MLHSMSRLTKQLRESQYPSRLRSHLFRDSSSANDCTCRSAVRMYAQACLASSLNTCRMRRVGYARQSFCQAILLRCTSEPWRGAEQDRFTHCCSISFSCSKTSKCKKVFLTLSWYWVRCSGSALSQRVSLDAMAFACTQQVQGGKLQEHMIAAVVAKLSKSLVWQMLWIENLPKRAGKRRKVLRIARKNRMAIAWPDAKRKNAFTPAKGAHCQTMFWNSAKQRQEQRTRVIIWVSGVNFGVSGLRFHLQTARVAWAV